MKPMTKQLVIAALILTFVTILSLGIRQVRFSLHRANTIENPVIADPKPDHVPVDPPTGDAEPDPYYVYASDLDVDDESEPQSADASESEKKTPFNNSPKAKSFKGNSAKPKGSKGLETLSLSDYENLYRTSEGQLWYVSKQPDGKTIKIQVQIDDTSGEITIVDVKSGDSKKGLEKISLGDDDNLYITEEGEQWYVTQEPDGSVSKSQVQIDDTTGEVTIITSENYAKSDNRRDGITKD